MSSIGSKFCSSAEDVDLDDGDATMNNQPDHSFSNIELMSRTLFTGNSHRGFFNIEPAAAAADSESEQESELQEEEQEKQRLQQAFKRQFARFVMKQPNFFDTATDEFTQYFDKLVIPLFEDRTGQLTRYCAAANRANELELKDDSNELIGDEMFKDTINNFQKWGAEEMKVMLEKHDVYINSFEQKKAKGAAEYTILFASCGEEEKVIPKNPLERREWETMNKVLLQSVVNKKGRIARKNVISQNKKDMKLKQLRGMTDSNSVDNGANKQLRRSARSSSVAGSVVNLEGDKNLKLPRDEFFKNLSDKK